MGVFLPHIYSIREFDSILKSDPALKKYKIKIFGRIKDLLALHKFSPYDVMILPDYFSQNPPAGMEPKFVFLQNGKPIHRSHVATLADFSENGQKLSMAAIDFVGNRRKSKERVKDITAMGIKRIKLVKKGIDLYPMLILANVTHILIDEIDMNRVVSESEVKLTTVKSIEVGNPVILVKKGVTKNYSGLLNIKSQTFKSLGYEKIRRLP